MLSLLVALTLVGTGLGTSVARAVPAAPLAVSPGAPNPPAPPPPPRFRAFISDATRIGHSLAALEGQRWRVAGTVAPYADGESVVVTFFRAGHHLRTVTAPVRRTRGGGYFLVPFRLDRPGRVRVYATLRVGGRVARVATVKVDVVQASASHGSGGLRVRYLQRRLRNLGYAVPQNGRFDDATQRAVIAFRKVNGMARNGEANHRVFFMLAYWRGAFRAKYPGHGRHLEADLGRQVLALIKPGGRVDRVYHISSGKPSTPTVRGSFYVYSQTPGYNSLGMLDSNYFIEGYAVHGYHEVPTYAASHGCIRAPVPDAGFLFHWIHDGTRIDVYG